MSSNHCPRTPEEVAAVQERNLRVAIGDELYEWLEQETKSTQEPLKG